MCEPSPPSDAAVAGRLQALDLDVFDSAERAIAARAKTLGRDRTAVAIHERKGLLFALERLKEARQIIKARAALQEAPHAHIPDIEAILWHMEAADRPTASDYARLRAAIQGQGQEAPHAPHWQPIETAPRTGERILVYWREGWADHDIAFWDTMENRGRGGWNSIRDCAAVEPTHWMPLPPSPGQGGEAPHAHPETPTEEGTHGVQDV